MQTIFAFGQCKEANYNIGLQEIDDLFQPDLNSMEVQDRGLLKANKEQAKAVLAEKVIRRALPEGLEISKEAQSAANNAHKNYLTNTKDDLARLKKSMVLDAESLVDHFLWVMSLLIAWSDLSKSEADKKKKLSPEKLLVGDYNLSQNRVIDFFRKSSKVQVALVKKDMSWEGEEDNLKSWYKDVLKRDETFNTYRRTANPTFDQDKEIVDYLIKQIVFKADVVLSYFEEQDIHWVENKSIIRSLVARSVRDVEEDTEPKSFELPDFSNNWGEDKEFFEKILDTTVQHDLEYNEMIAAKTKNWEVDRLANTDQIILKMAMVFLSQMKLLKYFQ